MPILTPQSVHYATILQSMSIDWYPQGLMAEQILPVLNVEHENDRFIIWNRDAIFRLAADTRADGARAKRVDFDFTYGGYMTTEHALEVMVTDRERKNADSQLNLELSKVRHAQGVLMMNEEVRIAALMATTTNYATSNQVNVGSVAANQWNNAAFTGSIEQIADGADEAVRIQTGGYAANLLIFPKAVAKVMKRDAKIRDLVKYTHADLLVDGDLPPQLWGKRVFIPAASYNSATEGLTATMGDVWGKHAYMLYKAGAPGIGVLNYGYIFRVGGVQIKTWREEEIDATMYRVSYNQAEQVVSPYCGYLLQGVIS